jgi:hypothetical protein
MGWGDRKKSQRIVKEELKTSGLARKQTGGAVPKGDPHRLALTAPLVCETTLERWGKSPGGCTAAVGRVSATGFTCAAKLKRKAKNSDKCKVCPPLPSRHSTRKHERGATSGLRYGYSAGTIIRSLLYHHTCSMSTNNIKLMWHVYVGKGTAFIPNVAKIEAGFFLDVDPVRIARLDDVAALTLTIARAMASGNPQVPTPNRVTFSKPVILKPAGGKNWNAFVEKGVCFKTFQSEEGVEIAETGRNNEGQWWISPR